MNEMRYAYQTVRENMEDAVARQEFYHNRKAQIRHFKVGDQVLLSVPPTEKVHCNRKFVPAWKPDYTILRKIGNLNVEITPTGKNKPFIVHIDRIKIQNIAEDYNRCSAWLDRLKLNPD